jgi:hypothetical protein
VVPLSCSVSLFATYLHAEQERYSLALVDCCEVLEHFPDNAKGVFMLLRVEQRVEGGGLGVGGWG